MDINSILGELRAERNRIERAISALEAVNSTGRRRAVRPPRAAAIQRKHRRLSAAARAKLSRLLKERWAQGKMRARAKQAHASKLARRMSRVGRKRIAAAQRARWAKVKAKRKVA